MSPFQRLARALTTLSALVDPPAPGSSKYYGTNVAGTKGFHSLDAASGVPTSRTLTAGTGLTGGGTLEADRTFAVTYGTTAGTSAQGNDSRLSDSRAPTGSAGGDLGGTYPNPTVSQARGLRESGGTTLTMGAVADGQQLVRSGTTIVGRNIAVWALAVTGVALASSPTVSTFAGSTWA